MSLKYIPDDDGWAHSLLRHTDGFAYYVGHRPDEYEHTVRWITNTGDEKAVGLALPCTAQPEGYTSEKQKGNMKILKSGQKKIFHCRFGILDQEEAESVQQLIQLTMKNIYTKKHQN